MTAAQNKERQAHPLTMPVLGMGGQFSSGGMSADTLKLAALNVQPLVLPDAGHWLAEQAPDPLVAALNAFLSE